MSGDDIYEDLKAVAAEHGVVPAFPFKQGDPPGKVSTVLIRLMPDRGTPGFVRFVIHDEPEPPDVQYLVEAERLRSLIDFPV